MRFSRFSVSKHFNHYMFFRWILGRLGEGVEVLNRFNLGRHQLPCHSLNDLNGSEKYHELIGGLEHDWLIFLYILGILDEEYGWWFGHILGIIIPIDELIFFRGVNIPPTR